MDKKGNINVVDVETFAVDMSVYKNMNSTKHNYKGISPKELIKIYNEKGSGSFYIGYDSCPYCQESVSLMNEAAESLGVTVYYIDAYLQGDPLKDYYDEVFDILYPVLEERDGKKTILTPHFFTIVNGEIVKSNIGGTGSSDQEIIENFKQLLEPLVSK